MSSRVRSLRSPSVDLSAARRQAALAQQQDPVPDAKSLENAFSKRAVREQRPYSPYSAMENPTHVYWGDTHLHTSYSLDAGAFGAAWPARAYRFARGEEVVSSTAGRAKLSRPLDFLVVADHSDNMGFFPAAVRRRPELLADPTGQALVRHDPAGGEQGVKAALEIIDTLLARARSRRRWLRCPGRRPIARPGTTPSRPPRSTTSPGRFTAFIGYEWTSNTGGNNLHRVVIFRDGGDKAMPVEPFTTTQAAGSDDPEDLWKWLAGLRGEDRRQRARHRAQRQLSATACMFPRGRVVHRRSPLDTRVRRDARPLGAALRSHADQGRRRGPPVPLAQRRVRRATRSGTRATSTSASRRSPRCCSTSTRAPRCRLGLKLEQKLGVNPYKFGMIGSTDSHTGLATAEEDNFFGKHSGTEPNPERAHAPVREVRRRGRSWAGSRSRPATPASGPPRTRARRSSTR